jgi:hypothetical protein
MNHFLSDILKTFSELPKTQDRITDFLFFIFVKWKKMHRIAYFYNDQTTRYGLTSRYRKIAS